MGSCRATTPLLVAALTSSITLLACGDSTDEQPAVTYDAAQCEYSGAAQLESGFVAFTLRNPTRNLAEAIFGKLEPGVSAAELAASVDAGAYDRFGLGDWTDPGQISATPVRMPPDSGDGIEQSVGLTTGDWRVICLDIQDNRAVLASQPFSVP